GRTASTGSVFGQRQQTLIHSFSQAVLNRQASRLLDIANEMKEQATLLKNCGYNDLADSIFLEFDKLMLVIEQIHEVRDQRDCDHSPS
uniref:hypothetical protein n=1 Tax=Pseudomonas sp. CBZ-4 TaxID=1163065 RepID=UPI000475697D